jgi:prepilin-type N-terminal cleavage/methylation domain-containing protein
MRKSKRKNEKNNFPASRGFTLMELIAALGLFTIVVFMGSSMFLTVMDVQRKSISLREAEDSLGYALNMMAREIRVGSNYNYNCSSDQCSFSFNNYLGDTITYELSSGSQIKIIKKTCIPDPNSDCGGVGQYTNQPVTPSNVEINRLNFNVQQTNGPAMVTIIISATAGEKQKTELNLQTTVSQR